MTVTSPLSLSTIATQHVARATGGAQPQWHQVCVRASIELQPGVVRALVKHFPATPALLRVSTADATVADQASAQRIRDALQLPARCVSLKIDAAGVGRLEIDAVASDRAGVSNWKPRPEECDRSESERLNLLGQFNRWVDAVAEACEAAAVSPFVITTLAWPMHQGAAVVERYVAGGPGAGEHARAKAAERMAQIEQARAQRPREFSFSRARAAAQREDGPGPASTEPGADAAAPASRG